MVEKTAVWECFNEEVQKRCPEITFSLVTGQPRKLPSGDDRKWNARISHMNDDPRWKGLHVDFHPSGSLILGSNSSDHPVVIKEVSSREVEFKRAFPERYFPNPGGEVYSSVSIPVSQGVENSGEARSVARELVDGFLAICGVLFSKVSQ